MAVELIFCDICDVSIAKKEAKSGKAVKVNGKWCCPECVVKHNIQTEKVCALCNTSFANGKRVAQELDGKLYCKRCYSKAQAAVASECPACGQFSAPLQDGAKLICRKCGKSMGKSVSKTSRASGAVRTGRDRGASGKGGSMAVLIAIVALAISFMSLWKYFETTKSTQATMQILSEKTAEHDTKLAGLQNMATRQDLDILAKRLDDLGSGLTAVVNDLSSADTARRNADQAFDGEIETFRKEIGALADELQALDEKTAQALAALEEKVTPDVAANIGLNDAMIEPVDAAADAAERQAALDKAIADLDSEDEMKRFLAVSRLQQLGGPEVVEPLMRMLGDSEAKIRASAAQGLGDVSSERVKEALIKAVDDPEWRVRVAVLRALAGYEGEEVISVMNKSSRDPDDMVRYLATQYLKKRE